MSDAPSQRNVPKRQIARLIGSSVYPMWVLSEDSRLVFTNEAFDELFADRIQDSLGLVCTVDAQGTLPDQTLFARWLALPANGSLDSVRCVKDSIPDGLGSGSSHWIRKPDATSNRSLLRWILPLDDSASPCHLCVLKADSGDTQAMLDADFHQRIEVPALSLLLSDAKLDGIWYLQGASVGTQTLRKQLQLAIASEHPLRFVAHCGNYLVALAIVLFKERRAQQAERRAQQAERRAPQAERRARLAPFIIDGSLMDKDLLQSTLDWIDDTRQSPNLPEVILHRMEQLPLELREPLARRCQEQNWNYLVTVGHASEPRLVQGGDLWESIIARASVQIIPIPSLASRTGEIESLLVAWMRKAPQARWSPAFLDALLAYSWPDDIDEMDRALEHAIGLSNEQILDESHLPISLRTYPSHIERDEANEPIVLDEVLERVERMLIEQALASHPRNNTAAAKSLGISRARLLRRMQQWGLGSAPAASSPQDEVIFEELDAGDD